MKWLVLAIAVIAALVGAAGIHQNEYVAKVGDERIPELYAIAIILAVLDILILAGWGLYKMVLA